MIKLKRALSASKAYRSDSWEDLENILGFSKAQISLVLNEKSKSPLLVDRIRKYIYRTGLEKAIKDLGLNPKSKKHELKSEPTLDPQHS